MATGIWCEIVCSMCAKADFGEYSFDSKLPRARLKSDARTAGWIFEKDEVFCCVECKDIYEDPTSI
jgi:hypothetical protein